MRKLVLQVQMTIDGFVAGPDGEMDWMVMPWTDDINSFVKDITDKVDTILLGRKLAEGFIPYWTNVAGDKSNPEHEAGSFFTKTKKIVFSKTLRGSHPSTDKWNNTRISDDDIEAEVKRLKHQEGNDIIVYGGATFVAALIEKHLIDEFNIFYNPAAIGNGMAIFGSLKTKQHMKIVGSHTFDCGIIVHRYNLI